MMSFVRRQGPQTERTIKYEFCYNLSPFTPFTVASRVPRLLGVESKMICISFDTVLLRGRGAFVAWTPQLDVSSCGDTEDKARQNLKTAVRLFLEEADRKGTLNEILEEAGYRNADQADGDRPRVVSTETMNVEVGV